ncbi:MAG: hypothetical protein DMG67_20145 [Acidobacteria bacterium]|nr:MAG: hypothetical protein DMG67_20145 [Acidobacteriota bacterium]
MHLQRESCKSLFIWAVGQFGRSTWDRFLMADNLEICPPMTTSAFFGTNPQLALTSELPVIRPEQWTYCHPMIVRYSLT